MEGVATAVLGLEGADIVDEVMHFLDRSGRVRVVAATHDPARLTEAIRQLEPDVVVASSSIAEAVDLLDGRCLLTLDTTETTRGLRAAIRAGARGYFLWPADREPLTAALAEAGRPRAKESHRGSTFAIIGARGGLGTTTIAVHLAVARAQAGSAVTLVDLDLDAADVSAVVAPSHPRTLADLVALLGEVTERQMEEILAQGPGGIRVLLAPQPAPSSEERTIGTRDVSGALASLRTRGDVVLHVPRGISPVVAPVLRQARGTAVVVGADRASVSAVDTLRRRGAIGGRCVAVLCDLRRGELGTRQLERELDLPLVVVPRDRGLDVSAAGRRRALRARTSRSLARVWHALDDGGGR